MGSPVLKLAYLGISMLVAGAHSTLSGVAGLAAYWAGFSDYREVHPSLVLIGSGLALLAIAVVLQKLPRPELSREDAFLVGVLVWVLTPLVSAVSLSLAGGFSYVDAVFESISGWTTTGLTVMTGGRSSAGGFLPKPEELPVCLQVWRSLSQWLGGLGVLTLTAYLLAGHRLSIAYLYSVEGRFQRISSNIYEAIRQLSVIYAAFTALSAILLAAAGMSLYDAVHHAMTGIATGGFSTHSSSIGFYESYAVYAAILVVVALGATSFLDLYHIARLKWRKLGDSVELKAFAASGLLVAAASLALWIADPVLRGDFENPLVLVFHALSGLTTAGFTIGDISGADDAYKFLIISAMLIGGSAFSTAGGIKLLRIVVIAKSVSWEIESSLKPPSYVSSRRIGSYVIDDVMLRRTLVTAALYVASVPVFAIMLWIALEGTRSFVDLMFESASALTGTGLSVNVVNAEAPVEAKLILSLAMLLGRLEILAFLAALSSLLSKTRRLASSGLRERS